LSDTFSWLLDPFTSSTLPYNGHPTERAVWVGSKTGVRNDGSTAAKPLMQGRIKFWKELYTIFWQLWTHTDEIIMTSISSKSWFGLLYFHPKNDKSTYKHPNFEYFVTEIQADAVVL